MATDNEEKIKEWLPVPRRFATRSEGLVQRSETDAGAPFESEVIAAICRQHPRRQPQ